MIKVTKEVDIPHNTLPKQKKTEKAVQKKILCEILKKGRLGEKEDQKKTKIAKKSFKKTLVFKKRPQQQHWFSSYFGILAHLSLHILHDYKHSRYNVYNDYAINKKIFLLKEWEQTNKAKAD